MDPRVDWKHSIKRILEKESVEWIHPAEDWDLILGLYEHDNEPQRSQRHGSNRLMHFWEITALSSVNFPVPDQLPFKAVAYLNIKSSAQHISHIYMIQMRSLNVT